MSLPDLDELLALRAAAHGLSLQVAHAARAPQPGSYQSTHRGRGLEFQEVRPYVEGDDPRSIDWRVTARRGRPHTKVYRQERERPVWIVADLDAGLFFGSRLQLKSALVVRAAALLAWTAAANGDRVGAVLAGSATQRILPPRARNEGVLPLLGGLLEMQPTAPAAPASPRSLASGLTALLPLIHPGSLILALSDFATLRPGDPFWPAVAAHNDCYLFWITDPLEEQGLPDGRFRVGFPGRSMLIDGAASRAAWHAKWTERRGRIEDLARQIAAPLTQLSTHEPVEAVLRPLFLGRRSAA
jgi:uncharacterized protein (DUF58 family)